MKKENNDLMEKVVSLCKRRGFVFPGSEIYGGLANSWDYGPLGVELKNNIKNLWWKKFVHERSDMVGIDAALIMNPKVWENSGHMEVFNDPLVECRKCHSRYRSDQINGKCPNCKSQEFTEAKQFNLMLKTFLGPTEEKASTVYLRPEIAQAMFVDFKSVLETSHKKLPFGIASQGRAFRNEITPGNFIFRQREFDLMEFEYFVKENDWKDSFEYWKKQMWSWMTDELGLTKSKIHELEIDEKDRAHYSKRTIDFEYEFPFGLKELYGLAYRTDFDLKNHYTQAPYKEEGEEAFYPHVIEPTFGVDRSVLAVLCDAYQEESERVVLKLKPHLAPYKAAVFPLLKNKPELVSKAQEIYTDLRKEFSIAFDDRGNIGKRYYSQDEIGTMVSITCDFQSLEDNSVTLRDRDTMQQIRIEISNLKETIKKLIDGEDFLKFGKPIK